MKDCWECTGKVDENLERSGKVDESLNRPVLGNRWMYIKDSAIGVVARLGGWIL